MDKYTKAVLTVIAVCVFSQSVYAKRPDLTNTYFTCELYDSRAFIKGIDDNQAQIISEIGLDIMGINYIYRPTMSGRTVEFYMILDETSGHVIIDIPGQPSPRVSNFVSYRLDRSTLKLHHQSGISHECERVNRRNFENAWSQFQNELAKDYKF